MQIRHAMLRPVLLSLVLVSTLASSSTAQGVDITYLGNEGFLLAAGEQSVLIDALFGDGLPSYPKVPVERRRALEAAEGPYAGVDLVLASHFHDDHFDPEAVARHLRANPAALFVSSEQAAREVLDQGIGPERVKGFWPAEGDRETLEHAGIELTVLRLHHGRSSAQNLGLLVTIGGVKVLHMGDTEISPDELARSGLDGEGIDVALVPYWKFDSASATAFFEQLGDPQRVAMHFPEADAPPSYFGARRDLAGQVAACRQTSPEAWMALEPGDTRSFTAPASRASEP